MLGKHAFIEPNLIFYFPNRWWEGNIDLDDSRRLVRRWMLHNRQKNKPISQISLSPTLLYILGISSSVIGNMNKNFYSMDGGWVSSFCCDISYQFMGNILPTKEWGFSLIAFLSLVSFLHWHRLEMYPCAYDHNILFQCRLSAKLKKIYSFWRYIGPRLMTPDKKKYFLWFMIILFSNAPAAVNTGSGEILISLTVYTHFILYLSQDRTPR